MPAPSPLSIATSAVNRLLKEESTYRKELAGQEERLRRLEGKDAKGGGGGGDEEGNREFSLKQEVSLHFSFPSFPPSSSSFRFGVIYACLFVSSVTSSFI